MEYACLCEHYCGVVLRKAEYREEYYWMEAQIYFSDTMQEGRYFGFRRIKDHVFMDALFLNETFHSAEEAIRAAWNSKWQNQVLAFPTMEEAIDFLDKRGQVLKG